MSEHETSGYIVREGQLHWVEDALDAVWSSEHFKNFLRNLADSAASVLGPDVFAGITSVRDGHPATVASSAPDANRFDEIQYNYNEGPCLTAMRTGNVILITDLAEDHRFGAYRDHALSVGAQSSLSLPLDGGDHALGALNLYSGRAHYFGQPELMEGKRFSGEASRALALAVRLVRQLEAVEQRHEALARHRVIDQAAGIIMGQTRCSMEIALSVLHSSSRNRDADIHDIAREIVTAATS